MTGVTGAEGRTMAQGPVFDVFVDTVDRWRWRVVIGADVVFSSPGSHASEGECRADVERFRGLVTGAPVLRDAFEAGGLLSGREDIDIVRRSKVLAAGSMGRSRLIDERCAGAVAGDFLEMGVFRGGTASILGWHAARSGRAVHLYDTFRGLPELSGGDAGAQDFRAGQMARTIAQVRANLQALGIDLSVFRWHEGEVNASTRVEGVIALAHLDMDLYGGTLEGCRVVWPRLARGGVILVHDYDNANLPGCGRAVDEFEASLPTGSFRASTREQCRVIERV